MENQTLWAFVTRDTYHGGSRRGVMDSFEFKRYMAGIAQTEDVCVVASPIRNPSALMTWLYMSGAPNYGPTEQIR